ncbi:flagellar hook-associated protein FlgK [Brucella intermedia]|uniref:flagellar hook-associated protein FlgK n=1 Tax=Brucella TaxID=234 RepID=UPI00094677FB|nr:flagellar hook-associated protein FlgK [Brucella intermedia]
MSLSSALSTARNSLAATSRQTSVVSRNLAGLNDPDYSRRTASLVSGSYGSQFVSIRRSSDDALLTRLTQSNSAFSSSSILAGGLDRLSSVFSGNDSSASPANLIGKLRNALHNFATSPSNSTLGDSAVSTARSLADALNTGTRQVQTLRQDADKEISQSVSRVNELLTRFEKVNRQIVSGTRLDNDVSDYLDQRDAILKELSGEIGITTVMRGDNDMVIFADNGVTLFETTARKLSFNPSGTLTPGFEGNPVLVDGIPLSHDTFDQPYGTGRLSGLLQLRDQIAPQYQSQLDEMARGLVTMFAERSQSGTGADKTGLFSWAGSPDVPDAKVSAGLAGSIRVSSAFVASEGGSSLLLRDGGANGADYKYNTTGSSGFSDRLRALGEAFSTPVSFDKAAGLSDRASLIDYSASSASWLEGKRKAAHEELTYNRTVTNQAEQALSNATGVNMSDEMALLLQLEHSYQATSRLLTTVNAMFDTLLRAV